MMSRLLAVAIAIGLWGAAFVLFVAPIYPEAKALTYPIYEDDGVYVGAAQLVAQGIAPYREFFFQHPPLGSVAYLPPILYHFSPWGSTTSFALARYWSAVWGSMAVGLILVCIYAATKDLAASSLAAMAAMLDSSLAFVARQTLLDIPMVVTDLLAALALLLTLRRAHALGAVAAGILTGMAGLIKLPGLAIAPAALLLLWRHDRKNALLYFCALLVTFLISLATTVKLAGPTALYQIFAYQALRPVDGTVGLVDRLRDFASPLHRQLLVASALMIGSAFTLRSSPSASLGILASIWGVLLLTALMMSRSFYPHYLADAVPAVYLGVGALLHVLRRSRTGWVGIPLAVLVVLGSGFQGTLGQLALGQDRIYVIVSRYASGTTEPNSYVLSLNPLFNYMAGRPLPEGWGWRYMLDSYGSMVYTGLELPLPGEGPARGPLVPSSRDVWELVKDSRPQLLIVSRLTASKLVIIDGVGSGRVAAQTATKLAECFDRVESQARYTIFRARPDTKGCLVGDALAPPHSPPLVNQARPSRKG